MTGLIPALAKKHGIPCLFTVHNIHTECFTLEMLEDRGIDAACFWQNLFFERQPHSYEETRADNPCDLLASGILAADHVNVVNPNFLTKPCMVITSVSLTPSAALSNTRPRPSKRAGSPIPQTGATIPPPIPSSDSTTDREMSKMARLRTR